MASRSLASTVGRRGMKGRHADVWRYLSRGTGWGWGSSWPLGKDPMVPAIYSRRAVLGTLGGSPNKSQAGCPMCSPGAEENGSGHPELRFADTADVVRSQKATLKHDKERMHQACAPVCYQESKPSQAHPWSRQETQQVQGRWGSAPDL